MLSVAHVKCVSESPPIPSYDEAMFVMRGINFLYNELLRILVRILEIGKVPSDSTFLFFLESDESTAFKIESNELVKF